MLTPADPMSFEGKQAESPFKQMKQSPGLTFEKEVRVILEGVVWLLHGNEAWVHCLPLLVVPGLCN